MKINLELTQKVINIILNSPQCMATIKDVPCYDYKDPTQLGLAYKARFSAFIRVKHGIILIKYIDWPKVAIAIKPHI